MAKRSKSGIGRGDPVSTGIYRTTADSASFDDPAAVKQLFDECGFDVTLDDILDGLDEAAAEVLATAAVKPHELKKRREAEKLVRDVQGLRRYMSGNAMPERVGYFAYYLGVLAERIGVREFEPDVDRGKRSKKSSRGANKARAEAYAKLAASYQPRVDEEMRGGRVSHTEACKRAAKHFRVVKWRTIFDKTVNTFKKPAKRRRKK